MAQLLLRAAHVAGSDDFIGGRFGATITHMDFSNVVGERIVALVNKLLSRLAFRILESAPKLGSGKLQEVAVTEKGIGLIGWVGGRLV